MVSCNAFRDTDHIHHYSASMDHILTFPSNMVEVIHGSIVHPLTTAFIMHQPSQSPMVGAFRDTKLVDKTEEASNPFHRFWAVGPRFQMQGRMFWVRRHHDRCYSLSMDNDNVTVQVERGFLWHSLQVTYLLPRTSRKSARQSVVFKHHQYKQAIGSRRDKVTFCFLPNNREPDTQNEFLLSEPYDMRFTRCQTNGQWRVMSNVQRSPLGDSTIHHSMIPWWDRCLPHHMLLVWKEETLSPESKQTCFIALWNSVTNDFHKYMCEEVLKLNYRIVSDVVHAFATVYSLPLSV